MIDASNQWWYSFTLRRLFIAGVVVVVCAAGLFIASARYRLSELPKLRTVEVQKRDLRITVGATGSIEPVEVVEVGALVSGTIIGFSEDPATATKPPQVGDRVSKGKILIRIDPQPYQVALRKAKAAERVSAAEVVRLETQLQQASRELQRAQRLRATNSESDFDKVFTAYETVRAELAISKARLEQAFSEVQEAQFNLDRTVIYAPINGVIIDSRVNLGQHVNPSNSGLFLLAHSLADMRIRVSVSETDIGKIHPGQPVSFTVDAHQGQVLKGRVDSILLNARVQSTFVTYDVLIAIDGMTEELLPHMTADVEFEVERRSSAWLVPSESLQWWPNQEQIAVSTEVVAPPEGATDLPAPEEGDLAYLWIPAGDGHVHGIRVRVGIHDGVHTEVIGETLQDKMPVVVGTVREATLARIIPSVKTFR